MLQSQMQNRDARRELERRGLSMIRADLRARVGRRLRIERYSIGDVRKSWDVLETALFLERQLAKSDAIIDFGAYHSEITSVLHRMGFSDLYGIDLNPKVVGGPFSDRVKYSVSDFLRTRFPDASFSAITSISAIEHGHSVEPLLAEVQRLLKPGGYFVGSTDYWPEKIDTAGIEMFGMDWKIFSAKEIDEFFDAARKRGLVPVGSPEHAASQRVVDCAGKQYSFAWFAMQKRLEGA